MMLPKLFTIFCLVVSAINFHEGTGKKLTENANYLIDKFEIDANYWIDKFNMNINHDRAWFTEIYRSTEKISHLPERYGENATRVFGTHTYYLLENKVFAVFHRLNSDQLWHFYQGAKLTLFVIDHVTGELTCHYLENSAKNFVVAVKRGDWYGARLTNPDVGKYSLFGITVSPGFEMEDNYEPTAKELITMYPKHKEVIKSLTRK
uniref:uncharacterized protein LOC120346090 n=1 Tax=Styela clava TaxID=7725 RepID=UPI00193A54A7|nr:uncharacterized protein LOC120346090 [Styela clava]